MANKVQKKKSNTNTHKKKNSTLKGKKGFTLIELIAVVVLLAIVSTMAVLSVSLIGSKIRSKQRDNLLSSMQVQAKKYVEETGIKKVYVDTLIKEGYVAGDKIESGKAVVVDPTDQSATLNCYYYDFTTDSWVPPTTSNPGDCSSKIYGDAIITIKYCITNCTSASAVYNKIDEGTWIPAETIYLKATMDGEIDIDGTVLNQSRIDESDTSVVWTTPDAPDVFVSGNPYKITKDSLATTYQVRVTINGKDYVASAYVKNDASEPIIRNVRTKFTVTADTWIKEDQYIYADFEDKGSGLKAFAITKSATPPAEGSSDWKEISGNTYNLNTDDNNVAIKASGDFYIYVKDTAGNIAKSSESIKIEHIDSTAPECLVPEGSTTWAKKRTITWGCKPEGLDDSGCEDDTPFSKTYTTTTKTDTIAKYTIKDKAGNETTCKATTVDIYVDKTAPTAELTIVSTKNYGTTGGSKDAKYTISGSDGHSGVDKVCFTDENSSANCEWLDNNNKEVAVSFGTQEGKGGTYTRYAFVKDKVGNVSKAATFEYKLYKECAEKKYDSGSNWSKCSKECNTGTQTRAQVDKYLANVSCGKATQECNKVKCCSDTKVDYNRCTLDEWSACSSDCGDGITKKFRTCDVVSNIDGSDCGDYVDVLEKKSCFIKPCCDEGEYEDYCTDDGWIMQRRYNGCEKEWQYKETSRSCEYTVGCEYERCPNPNTSETWGKSASEMIAYNICTYKEGGIEKTKTNYYDYKYCEYGYRDLICEDVWVTKCDGDSNYSTCYFEDGYSTSKTYRIWITLPTSSERPGECQGTHKYRGYLCSDRRYADDLYCRWGKCIYRCLKSGFYQECVVDESDVKDSSSDCS